MTGQGVAQGCLIWQVCASIIERRERGVVYSRALVHARRVGKPLVVLGGTWGRHGAGDLCIDKDPQACQAWKGQPAAPAFLRADIRSIPLPDGYAGAVFASHVLEHLPTVQDAVIAANELYRIAGAPDAVYVVYPHRWNPMAHLHIGHHLWVSRQGGRLVFQQR